MTQPGNYRMIAVSGTLYRLYNLLRSMNHGASNTTRFRTRNTDFIQAEAPCNQPLFILRHVKHTVQRIQSGSSRLYAAFIDFKQAYGCIPRHKLWGHLRSCRMPGHILSILKDLYHADEYTLLDGDKAASVQPSFGVKQECPLSPLLFAPLTINGVPSLPGGPWSHIRHTLFLDTPLSSL